MMLGKLEVPLCKGLGFVHRELSPQYVRGGDY